MKIKIDSVVIEVLSEKKNIVEVAKENGISIVAPCYNSESRVGCCKVCIIEVNGKKRFACGTKPVDGMVIVYKRLDLIEERSVAIEKYLESIKQKSSLDTSCNCSSETGEESCCETTDSCSC